MALWNGDDSLETIEGDLLSVEHAVTEMERLLAAPDTNTAVTLEQRSTSHLVLGAFILVLGLMACLDRGVPSSARTRPGRPAG